MGDESYASFYRAAFSCSSTCVGTVFFCFGAIVVGLRGLSHH